MKTVGFFRSPKIKSSEQAYIRGIGYSLWQEVQKELLILLISIFSPFCSKKKNLHLRTWEFLGSVRLSSIIKAFVSKLLKYDPVNFEVPVHFRDFNDVEGEITISFIIFLYSLLIVHFLSVPLRILLLWRVFHIQASFLHPWTQTAAVLGVFAVISD